MCYMTDTRRYEVVDAAGGTYTVLEYVNDVCAGGDFHWLDRYMALRAMRLYQNGVATHGRESEASLRRLWAAWSKSCS